jgi:hypothetical protein
MFNIGSLAVAIMESQYLAGLRGTMHGRRWSMRSLTDEEKNTLGKLNTWKSVQNVRFHDSKCST